ncbi:MAG: relaxase domain-containing protein [Phycicoccus sp.]|nr:relaxase domain-containing protein [Phycicoccus sp.]
MSIHKLTAGSGYDYLTRQVAAQDATDKGHTGLASYYAERGETPGQWIGTGMAGIDGLAAADAVTAEQMQALFGSGHHPLAAQRREQLQGPGLTDRDYQGVTRLGVPFKVFAGDVSAFRLEVASRIAGINEAAGLPGDWPIPADQRAKVRTEVAREFFVAEHGRQPEDARELAGLIARHSRPKTQAVAGFDLTFSPVKSVSTLWAVADPQVAARIELAHQGAVKDALTFIEHHALFTREGTNGVRQVDVQGMVATAFTHRDSRAGDPDLHTHVAVANKVQTRDGRWLSIDGRVLFKANVPASETYNTSLERRLHDGLGLRFAERANPDPRKRPVREVVDVDPALNQRWSARRAAIQVCHSELAADFQAAHGRPPTPVESLKLAQQATLATREAKHEPRTLAEQRQTWQAQAVEVLGGTKNVAAMISRALSPNVAPGATVNAAWVADASARVLEAMEARRSTWQTWHVRAEAQRQVRGAEVPTGQVDRLVDLLVGEVLDARSVSLARPEPGIVEPDLLRRADGSSVYTVAGAELFTSVRVMQAEQRLVAMAGRVDGHAVADSAVDMALLESAANGVTLNAGQAALVRTMATSGSRLQLAIAPAGAGKTTAMRALASAWTEGGGTVVGLAPSATAAAALREQINTSTDTLAKLTWSLEHGDLPGWAREIGPSTLVVIDEAGMADTLSLDTAVEFVVGRSGSVRLIGDDQQLAAIGAGGVLRDIQATHGATRLGELLRFADPAEGAASLALREGQSEALGFYLDSGRVHVGDMATMTEDVFTAWQADRGQGLDSIMLAPTRELVSELNQRARAHRLDQEQGPAGIPAGPALPTARLADGNQASIGELIITRSNDRALRTSSTDWVKNGDRWMVLGIHDAGDLTVAHTQSGRTVRLPAEYVQAFTELGYATTVHTAQGVSVDTMHALASGQETRQQLYTMMTRGALGNHIYLQVVGDGDPHSVIRPETVRPLTPTDLLEGMLARDDAPRSATTLLRAQADPATCLGQAAQRYADALYVAAEDVVGRDVVQTLDASADQVVPGLSQEPAWPALRAHLLLLGAHGANPVEHLRAATNERQLDTAGDKAAVLDWRLDDTGLRNAGRGPLPWLPGVPEALAAHEQWGQYLAARSARVVGLAQQVRAAAEAGSGQSPSWAHQGGGRLAAGVLGDAAVWRSAMQVDPADRRPTGAPAMQKAAAIWQRSLDRRLSGAVTPALQEWGELIERAAPDVHADAFAPILAERLAAMSRAGVDARGLLAAAVAGGTLPDDHAAAALWWRISRHLSPAVAEQIDADHALTTLWTPRLVELVGADRADAVQSSPWWPTLVSTVDHGIARGWRLEDLLSSNTASTAGDVDDECLAMVWRMSVRMDPVPEEDPHDPSQQEPPEDIWDGVVPPADALGFAQWDEPASRDRARQPVDAVDGSPAPDVDHLDVYELVGVESDLMLAGMLRDVLGAPEQTDADVDVMLARAMEWDYCSVSRERMLQINDLSLRFFQDQFPDSWGRPYLAERFGVDLIEHPHFRPGQAPAGWTGLVNHLRRRGVTDEEMLATGVATTASTGRLIDRFRNRVMFPIAHNGEVLGFVGRRHPDLTEADKGGPKYLNTADTPLFHKGAQLFGAVGPHLAAGAVPVIVEGPMDAIAVTIGAAGSHFGVAPLGTSLTKEQAAQLGRLGVDPIVATDADLPGQVAAERDFWMLTPYGLDPGYAQFPEGLDPSDMLELRGPARLREALLGARPLAEVLVEERLANLPPAQAISEAAQVVAARPSARWADGTDRISSRLPASLATLRPDLLSAVTEWNRDPRKAAQKPLQNITEVRARLAAASTRPPYERWASLAAELDPRLVCQGDWPALASLMQDAHTQGHDVATAARTLVAEEPLGELPAQDLRYRLVARLDVDIDDSPRLPGPRDSSPGTAQERKQPAPAGPRPPGRHR